VARVLTAAETSPTGYGWEIRATGLRVRAGRRRYAVDGVDLALGPGLHGLLGPNGAGKTTLLRALATALPPAGGELELLGVPVTAGPLRPVRRQIGYLPQELGYYRRFTVREFVTYLAWLKEVPAADVPEAVQRALDRLGLADRAGDRMRTLSGGTLRRVGIAQAVVNDPRILLLDEPTAGLDPEQRLRLRELLAEIATDTCVVLATHLVEDVLAACGSVRLIDGGRVVFHGTAAELTAADSGEDEDGAGIGAGASRAERGYAALLARARSGGAPR
jgi:ABC-2 type transport system ATP-binding protein